MADIDHCLECKGSGNHPSWRDLIPFYPKTKCHKCDGNGISWKSAAEKPPNEIWVEVKDGNSIIEAMAFFGRDGHKPHWQLRNGTCCHPNRFNHWREINENS